MNGRREASRWSGSPILPYGFGDRRMRVRTGMRSIPCAATPWSMVRVHDIAIACTRLGISTPYHGSYHVRDVCSRVFQSSSGVLCTPGRARGVFLPGVFLPIADRVTRSFLRTAGTGPRPGCALLLRHTVGGFRVRSVKDGRRRGSENGPSPK